MASSVNNPSNLNQPVDEEIILDNNDDDDFDNNDETTNFLEPTSSPTSVRPSNPSTMAFEDNPKKPKHKSTSHAVSTFFQHMTTVSHACILLFVILIIYFCFSEEFVFFTWHPLLLSTGWMFLMTEAILSLSKHNLFTGTLPKGIRVRLHWIFQAIGFVLIITGFIVVFLNKNALGKSHFKTWHALFGFIGIVCSIPANLSGIAALFNVDLRLYIRPKINKFIHIVCGTTSFGFGGLSLILSVYTNWFAKHSNHNVMTFVLGLVLVSVAVLWTFMRPVATCCRQLKHLM